MSLIAADGLTAKRRAAADRAALLERAHDPPPQIQEMPA
jgi:hypothetical protein